MEGAHSLCLYYLINGLYVSIFGRFGLVADDLAASFRAPVANVSALWAVHAPPWLPCAESLPSPLVADSAMYRSCKSEDKGKL
jgi:hypothetical protein